MNIVVSACLLGTNCKYNGKNNRNEALLTWLADKHVIPVCPEVMGGLPTPRVSAELRGGIAINKEGENVHEAFTKGAACALQKLEGQEIDLAILQPRSPSCGARQIYDGTFSGTLIAGQGLFAKALTERGYCVLDVDEWSEQYLDQNK